MLKSTWEVLKDAYHRFYADDGFPNSGNIAYCVILAVFPFLIFLFSLTGFFVDDDMANSAVNQLIHIIPAEIIEPLEGEIKKLLTEARHDLLTISGFFTLWTASRGIESLRNALNRAYRLTETRPVWWRVVQYFLFVIFGAAISLALAVTIAAVPTIWSAISGAEPGTASSTDAPREVLRFVIGVTLLTTALIAGHKFLPARALPLRLLWPGILLTMVLWIAAGMGYSIYLANFAHFASLYAGLGGLFAALIFIYISAAIFQFGGEINRAMYARRNAGREMPANALGKEKSKKD